jgi:hypothetical protein
MSDDTWTERSVKGGKVIRTKAAAVAVYEDGSVNWDGSAPTVDSAVRVLRETIEKLERAR